MIYERILVQLHGLIPLLGLIDQLSGMMEGITLSHHVNLQEQVYSSTTEEKRLYQKLEQMHKQFLESCLASDSSGGKNYQLVTELAARENISAQEVQRKFLVLASKLDEIVKLATDCKKDFYSPAYSNRKFKKSLKRQLVLSTRCNELTAEVINDFWNYLSIDSKKGLEDFAQILPSIGVEKHICRVEARLSYYGKLSDIAKKILRFYQSIFHLNTALAKVTRLVEVEDDECEADDLANFFDRIMESALDDPSQYLEVYTEEMAAEDDELIKDVLIDD